MSVQPFRACQLLPGDAHRLALPLRNIQGLDQGQRTSAGRGGPLSHEASRRTALRMLAVANALEGMSRAEAARLVGMERQALHDAVVRYNAEGPAGLRDRPKPGRPERLSEADAVIA